MEFVGRVLTPMLSTKPKYSMDRTFLLHVTLASVIVCATAQVEFYSPYQIATINNNPPSNFFQRYVSPQVYPPSRRSGSCSEHPGSTCMFVLLCVMGGGVAAGPCSGTLLSTCCIPPAALNVVTPPQTRQQPPAQTFNVVAPSSPLPTRPPKRWTPPDFAAITQTETPTEREDVTVPTMPIKSAGNVTYCGITTPKPQSRIIGGNDAMYGEFPWQAHIKLKKQQCGGVLLNNFYVLTAAHCIYQVRLTDITIQLGVYDIQDQSKQQFAPQTFSVVEKKIHPKFKYQAAHPDRYDVALLKLNKAAQYHESVVPICLPRKDWNFQGFKGIITGWGKTDAGLSNRYGTRLLQKVDVPIISNEQCEKWHDEKGIAITVSPEMLCAGYEEGKKDACVGDSGGPLMVRVQNRWVVVGLVSAGFGCAQGKQPGIYHRVTNTVDWLRKSIAS